MASNLDIIIPIAGLGRRMKSYGPKSLIPVNGEAVIARQIRILSEEYPGSRVIVVTGFEADKVRKALPHSVVTIHNPLYETTNVAYSLMLGMKPLKPERLAMVVYGDLVFTKSLVEHIPLDRSSVLVEDSKEREEEVGVNLVQGKAAHFSFGFPVRWAQILMMTAEDKAKFVKLASDPRKSKFYGYEILNDMIDTGSVLHSIWRPLSNVVEIDTSKDISRAMEIDVDIPAN